jgi:hypothetical protein
MHASTDPTGRQGVAERAKQVLGPRLTTRLRCLLRGYESVRWGNLRRTTPLSSTFGFERGTPIDRHYLHRFLDRHRHLITGDVLEVQNDAYTRRFGHDVRRADTFDIVPQFRPTYICDLADSEDVLPTAAYDCLLLPNTLQHLRKLDACLAHAIRIVRPGGAILASAAGLIPLTNDVPDYWRFSPDGWREVLNRHWPAADVTVTGHGNCLSSAAAQFGLALEELTEAELDVHDSRFPVLTTIVCRKPL